MTSHPGDHAHIQALMPWVLNGQADATQQAEVAQHLSHCPACREEMARQRQLQAALQLPAPSAPDAERGLDRLMQRIELASAAPAPAPAAASRPARTSRLSLALAACVALQAVAIAVLAPRAWHAPNDEYRLLSQAVPLVKAQLRVLPAPQLSLAEWQALLQSEQLQVVAGPNALGAYALGTTTPKVDMPALLARLRSRADLRLVEPLAEDAP